jgi:hypothetical protein
MIEFVGHEYRYNNEQLATPEIIFVADHHYNEELHQFPVKQLLENSLCDPKQHTVVFDHVLQHNDVLKEYNLVCLPILMANYTNLFVQQQIVPDWNQKYRTFNFMINKIRFHRTFLLMLLEMFDLRDCEYTLCWKHTDVNRNAMIRETDNIAYQKIILSTGIDITPRQYLFGTERPLDQGLQYGSITNPQVYQQFLQQYVFEPTCVSLITEPAFFERETIITEKTIMAIYGGTIPVWVGGWRIADYMRDQGFDVFDDIVDHSYQDLEDPWDRCYYAIERNLHLLRDFETIQKFVYDNKHRLQANLDLLETNTFVNICYTKIEDINDNLVKTTLINKFSWLTHNP